MKKIVVLTCIGLLGLLLHSCKKEQGTDMAHLNVHMTDAPGDYDAVNIDLQSVEVTGDNGSAVALNVNAGVYNLLDFRNGTDTLIAMADMKPGTVEQIRLILGPNNTIVVDGVTYPLSTPSAMQSGLKLNLHQPLVAGVTYNLLLDFDAQKSIVVEGNGDYKLKPVIRVIESAITGSIQGSITPIGVIADVKVTGNGEYTTVTSSAGEFLIKGLPAGKYSVTITPPFPLMAVTLNDVNVTIGESTNLGIIALQ